MSRRLYADLAWLPRPPSDFALQCRALDEAPEPVGARLQHLAGHALGEVDLARLAKAIGRLRAAGRPLAPLEPFRLGILSNATTDLLIPAIIATGARHGFAVECVAGRFGAQDALAAESDFNRAACDAVLIAFDYHGLALRPRPGDRADAAQAVSAAFDHIDSVRRSVRRHSGAFSIVQTLARPPETLFGSFDMVLPGSMRRIVEDFNRRLAEYIADDYLFDVAGLAETVGLADWHDPTLWNMAKLPFAAEFVPLYADALCRLIAAVRGKSRRCLVLDLDDTLWSGVIGDAGLEGIVLAQGDATGEAHLELQRSAVALYDRGVVLAVCSKNDDAVARAPFRRHPEMLLREDQIAVFQANWQDKAANIKATAEQLSLGLSSLAFVDDNPAERALVRRMLPEIAVPELPADPALYARTLHAAGYFEAVGFSDEDRKRNLFYQGNARRVSLQGQAGDLDAYLVSLEMQIELRPFDQTGRARIAQLIAKSNQYNLTTRRYSEAEIAEVETNPDCFALQVRLTDIFGDNGMISVVICRRDGTDWRIDAWLMSCRVLGRRVEYAVLQEILANARAAGIARLIGVYRPSGRNRLVEDHYARLGFTAAEHGPDGTSIWHLAVAGDERPPAMPIPIKVRASAA